MKGVVLLCYSLVCGGVCTVAGLVVSCLPPLGVWLAVTGVLAVVSGVGGWRLMAAWDRRTR